MTGLLVEEEELHNLQKTEQKKKEAEKRLLQSSKRAGADAAEQLERNKKAQWAVCKNARVRSEEKPLLHRNHIMSFYYSPAPY